MERIEHDGEENDLIPKCLVLCYNVYLEKNKLNNETSSIR